MLPTVLSPSSVIVAGALEGVTSEPRKFAVAPAPFGMAPIQLPDRDQVPPPSTAHCGPTLIEKLSNQPVPVALRDSVSPAPAIAARSASVKSSIPPSTNPSVALRTPFR